MTKEPTPQEEIESAKSQGMPIHLTDSFVNALRIGDLEIRSPTLTMTNLVKYTKFILKDDKIMEYLTFKKSESKSNSRSFIG